MGGTHCKRPQLHPDCVVVDRVPRARACADRPGFQPARGWSPGLDRPTPSWEPRRRGAGVSEDGQTPAAVTDPVLRVRDLSVRFDSGRNVVVHAVNSVSFDLEASGALGLVGESGSGKSVTSLAILRLLPPATARIAAGEVW